MSNADPRGKFVWHELMTSDAGAATAFYTKVVPWKTQPWEKDSSYSMWIAKNGPVGGVASIEDSGSPRWIAYVGVSDVSATVQSAKSLGARVIKDATEIPNGGVYALLADPQGAEFGIYASAQHTSDDMPDEAAGDFTWHELATTDAEAAIKFYSELFGWKLSATHDMGPAGNYYLLGRDGKDFGGVFVSKDSGPPNWLCYIGVEDAGKAAKAVTAGGGRIVNGPMEVPGGSWVAQALDGEGVAFAVHEPAKVAAAKPASEPAAKPKSSITKPPKSKPAGGAASSITKPPQADEGGAASSITKPPKAAATGGGAASSITKPPKAAAKGGGAASSITKPPEQPPAEGGGGASVGSTAAKPKSSITKPPKSAKKPAKKAGKKASSRKSSITKPPKSAKKGKKAAAKKAPAKAAAKKSAARKAKKSPKPKSSITKPPKGKKKAPAKKKAAKKK